jgi:hypothetical protein
VNCTVASRPSNADSDAPIRSAKLLHTISSMGSCMRLMRCASGRRPHAGGRSSPAAPIPLPRKWRRALHGVARPAAFARRHHCTTKLVNSRSSMSAALLLLHGADLGERLLTQLFLAFARHQRLIVAIAHEQQQVVADQRDVLCARCRWPFDRAPSLHGDLQEAHHGAVLEIDHQGGSMA